MRRSGRSRSRTSTASAQSPQLLYGPMLATSLFFLNAAPTTGIYTLSLHDALPILSPSVSRSTQRSGVSGVTLTVSRLPRSEEHTSELQSRGHLVCRLLLEKKKEHGSSPTLSRTPSCRCSRLWLSLWVSS